MTAWTDAERAQIREYIGYSAQFHQFDPTVENAITAVQAVADGGVLATSDTQTLIRSYMSQLASIDSQITNLLPLAFVNDAGDEKVNVKPMHAVRFLEQQGRKLITRLCIPLGLEGPRKDYYSSLPINTSPNPFSSYLGPYTDG